MNSGNLSKVALSALLGLAMQPAWAQDAPSAESPSEREAQEAYEQAFDALFDTLDFLEELLERQRYLVGNRITEADWRLFPTLIRFDAVYYTHFKCNLRRIEDYPNLSNYLRELYQQPGIADTVDMHHIKHHYFASHESINPLRIVPKGPLLDYDRPHDRTRFD